MSKTIKLKIGRQTLKLFFYLLSDIRKIMFEHDTVGEEDNEILVVMEYSIKPGVLGSTTRLYSC
jgi:hypothetical protein